MKTTAITNAINAIKATLKENDIHRDDVVDMFFFHTNEEEDFKRDVRDIDDVYSLLGEADETAGGLWDKGYEYYDAHRLQGDDFYKVADVIFDMFNQMFN